MKIETSREELLPSLTMIGGVVEKRQTLPILGNVLFQVEDGSACLTTTDLEVGIRTCCSIKSDEEGAFTLPARKLVDICKALPEDAEIDISVGNETAVLRSGRSRFTLGVLPASDYPNLEIRPADLSFKIPEGDFKSLIDRTSFSMAQQDVRYYLNGMLMEIETGSIRTVATDGHRLAINQKDVDIEITDATQVLIPRKAVVELGRLMRYSDDETIVSVSENSARFVVGGTIFTTKLIDGKFPDYDRVIPKNADKVAIANREELKIALSRASILSSEKYKGIKLSFANNIVQMQAHNPEKEQAEEEIVIEYQRDPVTIGFNVGYLIDILNALNTEKVAIDLADSNSSAVIRVPGENSNLFVVMPMRL